MARVSLAQIRRRLQYAETTLASGAGLTPGTRAELEKSAALYRSKLPPVPAKSTICIRCSKPLTAPKSIANRMGDTCCQKAA